MFMWSQDWPPLQTLDNSALRQPLTQHGRGAGDRVTQSHHWAIARAGGRHHRFLLLPTERNECLTS